MLDATVFNVNATVFHPFWWRAYEAAILTHTNNCFHLAYVHTHTQTQHPPMYKLIRLTRTLVTERK